MPCEDTLWLDIADRDECCVIRQTQRLRTLIHCLPRPYDQTPTLALLFESPERKYFPETEEYGIHLRLDHETIGGRHPLLVANTQSLLSHWPPRYPLTQSFRGSFVSQEVSFPRQESISVLPKILLPFADVLCFVCMNQSDLRAVEAQINQWTLAWRDAGTGTPMPGVVVLLAEQGHLQPVQVQKQLMRMLPMAKISVVRMDQSTWATNGLKPIRKRLSQVASRARRWRSNRKALFSGGHMMGLLEESIETSQTRRPFHYIEASRSRHPVAPDLAKHLGNYIQELPAGYDEGFVAETVASAFLLDHFTPGMHDFDIFDVFSVLYRPSCREISKDNEFPATETILGHMSRLHAQFENAGSITSIHRKTMNRHREKWLGVEGSVRTCFVCLRRRPEYLLPCTHTLCLNCVKDFGDQCLQNPYRFNVRSCLLCGLACDLVVQDRPPTAGIGLLCLDGGGVRGIVQTEILRILEERIGLPIPVQEHFQLAAGVSAGGLNLIALYLKGWNPSVCTGKYEEMAKVIFRKGILQQIPVLSTVLSLWNRALYSADTLETVLTETYGEKAAMWGPSYATSIGTRIILPVARSPEPSILLFTNYNKAGEGARALGYEMHGDCRNVPVPEIARSCTAAPTFFQPKFIPGIGWLQDAGMVENNPISLLLSQYHELYPPDSRCQFILNIGSGSKPEETEHAHRGQASGGLGGLGAILGTYKTSALHRIISAYEWLLGGLSSWEKYTRFIDRSSDMRSRCVRLDVSLEQGTEPKLDDVQAVPGLKERVRNDATLSVGIDRMADSIVASLFYFELLKMPVHDGSMFTGTGRILCLRKSGDPALTLLVEKLVASNAKFVVNDRILGGNMLSALFWDEMGNFSMPTEFRVVGQELSVSLAWPDGRSYPISGSPYLIRTLVRAQGLDAPFGLPDHRRRRRAPRQIHPALLDPDCDGQKRRLKRWPTGIDKEKYCKRRRLCR